MKSTSSKSTKERNNIIFYHGTTSSCKTNSIKANGFYKNIGNYGLAAYFSSDYCMVLKYANNVKKQVLSAMIPMDRIKTFDIEKDFYSWYRSLPLTANDVNVWLSEISVYVSNQGYDGIYIKQSKTAAIYNTEIIQIMDGGT